MTLASRTSLHHQLPLAAPHGTFRERILFLVFSLEKVEEC